MKKIRTIISILLVSSILFMGSLSYPEEVLGAWYNASWSYRVKITIQSSQVDADLTDFPIYVDLSDLPADFHANVNQTDARDIRVTKSDGLTEVPREVVFYTSGSDTGELHFKADGTLSSSTDAVFYIYYGNAGASEPAIDSTYGAENVWGSDFRAVWHMQEDPSGSAPQTIDSSTNDFDGTSGGSMLTEDLVDGKFGKALDFDGTDDRITFTSSDIPADFPFTYSAWVQKTNAGTTVFSSTQAGVNTVFYDLKASTVVQIQARNGGTGNQQTTGTNATVDDGDWKYVSAVFTSATDREIFLNGVSEGSGNTTSVTYSATVSVFNIGRRGNIAGAQYFADLIDEGRVMGVARDITWLSTEYNNQKPDSTFYSVDSQEVAPIDAKPVIKGGGKIILKGGGKIIIK